MKNSAHPLRRHSTGSGTSTSLHSRYRLCAVIALVFASTLHAQQPPSPAAQPTVGGNWERVKALPIKTSLHVTTDHGGKSCRIFAVTDETLTCAKGSNAGTVIQRTEIKHIKLTHYVRSTLVGTGIGGGIGAISGGIAGRTPPCPAGGGFCFNGIGLGPGAVALVFGVGAGVIGGVVGGVTDLARGSSIYTRP